ncbi:hypothetical protein [Natrononativus amylolyticus]|uniref:hypothetical protein n=1 Tax=Natrononativus amylolyticus TaxID=2963434 RepID=UPI0020CE95F0|nr:hypothetical protein [Natrononativus amylolyticus]
MRRRTLLAAVAGGAAVGTAGCLASGRDLAAPGSDDDSVTASDGYYEIGEPAEAEGTVSHRLVLENDADEGREVTIEIAIDDEPAFEDILDLAAGDRLEFRLVEPTGYRLALESEDSSVDLALEGASTDCTESETVVTLRRGGVATRTAHTSGDCPSEEGAEGSEFEFGEGECATAGATDRARIDLEDDVIRIEGVVETPTPCHRLSLASLETDRETLEVVVGVDDPAADVCIECLGAVPYTAVVDRPDPPPESVVVVHETMGERRTVAEFRC